VRHVPGPGHCPDIEEQLNSVASEEPLKPLQRPSGMADGVDEHSLA
jgi:hypothetical protein